MPPRYLRPLLLFEFLIALEVTFTCWSQIGGQYHLDLMFWPWKMGLAGAISLLVVLITGDLVRADGRFTKKARLYAALLVLAIATAGLVTYYYHLNEPQDDNDDDDQAPAITQTMDAAGLHLRHGLERGRNRAPHAPRA
ncbi:MAG: hypothetical protein KGN84_09315 [Acidobacteriota bacterium]|nr:hypothetical protein [Acidobacteriota bacterium]